MVGEETLGSGFQGDVLRSGHAGYDAARRVWNGMIDRHPELIARCTGAADAVEALRFAREQDLVVAVRGGGHGVAGNAVCDGGLVVDLSAMKGIRVDPVKGTARAEAGVTLGELDRATQAFGLAAPLGVVTETGIAGLTLAGGIGWLRRKHGLSCDNLVSAEIVTADGRLLRASDTENSDLFWGIRGGGGNFGIVTSFEYRLHPVGPEVMFCFTVYLGERIAEVLGSCDAYLAKAPDDVSPVCVLGHVPEAEPFPAKWYGRPYVAVLAMYPGDPVEGARVLSPLRELGEPIADLSGPMPYTAAQALLDEDYPDGRRYYWKSTDLSGVGDEVGERLAKHIAAAPSHHSTIDVWFHGGAMSRVDPAATAFGARPDYLVGVEANWDSPEASDENIAWARRVVSDLEQFSDGGSYLNFPGLFEEGESLLRASYGDENYERLVELKNAYDPANVFRLNGNIAPTV